MEKFKRNLAPETRDHLAELARERHKNGGFKKGSGSKPKKRKPSKKRVAQLVAEAALEKRAAQQIIDVFRDGIADHQPMSIRLKAAEAWIKVEADEAKQALREENAQGEALDRGAALKLLSERLTQGSAALILQKHLEAQTAEPIDDADDVIEGTVVED